MVNHTGVCSNTDVVLTQKSQHLAKGFKVNCLQYENFSYQDSNPETLETERTFSYFHRKNECGIFIGNIFNIIHI
jgi:hypothetical protein